MLGGIGAKGGKKDLKQTRKNIKRKQQQTQKEFAKKIKQEQKMKNEKKKKVITSFSQSNKILAILPKKDKPNEIKQQAKETLITKGKQQEVLPQKGNSSNIEQKNKETLKIKQHDIPSKKQEKSPVLGQTSVLKKITKEQQNHIKEEEILPLKMNFTKDNIKLGEKKEQTNTPLNPTLPKPKEVLSSSKDAIIEIKVIHELEQRLKDNRYQLKLLYTQLDTIKQEQDDLYQVADVIEKIEEINRLLDQLNKIKKEIELLNPDQNLNLVYQLDDHYFTHLVDEYKSYISDVKMNEVMQGVKKEELYTSLIEKLITIEQTQQQLKEELVAKEKEFNERDQKMNQLEEKYIDVEKIAQDLEKLVNEQKERLMTIENKIKQGVSATKKFQLQANYSMGIIAKTILLFSLFKMNPKPKANAITAVEILVAANLISNIFQPKWHYRETIQYTYHDYQNLIEQSLKDTESIFSLIDTSLEKISDVKNTIEKEFREYLDDIPEYQSLLSSVETLEKELLERQENMHQIKQNMNQQLTTNQHKVYQYQNQQQ